jgi:hypothetical protein
VLNRRVDSVLDQLRENASMTVAGMTLIADEAHAEALLEERRHHLNECVGQTVGRLEVLPVKT